MRSACPRDPVGERLAFQVLHDQEVDAILVANVMQRTNVRVIELRNCAGLTFEPLAELRVGRKVLGQDFDRDDPIEPRITPLVDLAHAASPERRKDLVWAESRTGLQRHAI